VGTGKLVEICRILFAVELSFISFIFKRCISCWNYLPSFVAIFSSLTVFKNSLLSVNLSRFF